MTEDRSLLEAALVGYTHQRDQLDIKIAEIRQELGTGGSAAVKSAPKTRLMSAAARKRIAAAQKKRWAAYHKSSPAPAKKVAKRQLSPAAVKRISDATKKRWADYRAQ